MLKQPAIIAGRQIELRSTRRNPELCFSTFGEAAIVFAVILVVEFLIFVF
jgi:hypothetical protein